MYGILIDFIESIPDKTRLKHLIYDDVCHLFWFGQNILVLNRNPETEFFSKLDCSIDKFHFKNHVDAYCHEHFDPNKKKDLDNVNTEICKGGE